MPDNHFGSQETVEGDAYVAFYTYHLFDGPNTRAYFTQELSEPLQAGMTYCFSLFANLAGRSVFGTLGFNAMFTAEQPSACNYADTLIWPDASQIELYTNDVDTSYWMQLSDSFVADGTERHITIGHFHGFHPPDTLFAGWNNGDLDPQAIYFIDQVSLTACDQIGIAEHTARSIGVYPNPAEGLVRVTVPPSMIGSRLELVDALGTLITETRIATSGIDWDLSPIAPGCYFIHAIHQGETVSQRLILQ